MWRRIVRRLFSLSTFLGCVCLFSVNALAQNAAPDSGAVAPALDKSGYTLFDPTPDSQMRSFSTDRPNKSTSPTTLDAGHFQYETDLLGTTMDGYNGSRTYSRGLFTADPMLKLGLTNEIDFEIRSGGYQDQRVKQRGSGPASVYDGYGDTTLRAKVNIWGNDGGKTAFALVPYVKLPISDRGLGNNQVEGGLIAPLSISLSHNFTVIFQTEMDALKSRNDSGKHVGWTNLVNVSYSVTDKLAASAESHRSVWVGWPIPRPL